MTSQTPIPDTEHLAGQALAIRRDGIRMVTPARPLHPVDRARLGCVPRHARGARAAAAPAPARVLPGRLAAGPTTLLGVSHQAIDDLAILRALPNMTRIEPSGPEQMRAAVRATAEHRGPVYLRMKRADARPQHEVPLTIGRGQILRQGTEGSVSRD